MAAHAGADRQRLQRGDAFVGRTSSITTTSAGGISAAEIAASAYSISAVVVVGNHHDMSGPPDISVHRFEARIATV